MTPDDIAVLVAVAGLDIDPQRYPALAASIERYLSALRAIPLKDMFDVHPGIEFNASWEEHQDRG